MALPISPATQQSMALGEAKTRSEVGHYSNMVSKFLAQSENLTRGRNMEASLRGNRSENTAVFPSSRNRKPVEDRQSGGFSKPQYVLENPSVGRLVRKGIQGSPEGGLFQKQFY